MAEGSFLFFPRVDDGHAASDKGFGIARRHAISVYGCDCGNLTVRHGDETAVGAGAADQGRLGHRSLLVERQHARFEQPRHEFAQCAAKPFFALAIRQDFNPTSSSARLVAVK